MGRTTKVVGFSVPPAVAEEVAQLAKAEHRTQSALFRDMLRIYQQFRARRDRDEARWMDDLIHEVHEAERHHPLTPEALLHEEAELADYGARQAQRAGITPRDLPRRLAAARQRHRTARRP